MEIDTSLAAQEIELTLQLQSIQEKRHSLKNTIGLFVPDTTTPIPVATPNLVVEAPAEPVGQKVTTPELDEAKIEPSAQKPPAKKNPTPASNKQNKKSIPVKGTNQEIDTWQQYLRDDFVDASLSLAVSEVVEQQPEQVLEITNIISAIFIDEMPKEVRSKARERVSNILSVGTKQGRWYRRDAGKYSVTNAALN